VSVKLRAEKGVGDLLAEARERIRRHSPREALARLEAGTVLVDLRSDDERARDGVIPGSVHIPRSVLEWRVDPGSGWANPAVADRDAELILVCNEGYSSSLAAADLVALGFGATGDLAGGFAAWRDEGLPVRPATAPAPGLPGMGGPEW
jgi:rhodanese-related sulfurtransferase